MSIQPTNAGINYQQRIGALFLATMLTESMLDTWLEGTDGTLQSIRFESNDNVDDIVLENNTGNFYYIQAKRTLSLSILTTSEFYKSISQFVREYLTNPEKGKYFLAISSNSSAAITDRLRRLLNNIRRNHKIDNLPLNKKDKTTLETFFTTISLAYKMHTNDDINKETLLILCERIYILVCDIEDGLSDERACKMLLASFNKLNFNALWNALIIDALDFATNRSIVTKNYIKDKYKNFSTSKKREKIFSPELIGEVQIGYDIILCHSPQLLEIAKECACTNTQSANKDSLIILQLYRFDESGKKKLSKFYPNNKLIMPSGIEVEILYRCASLSRMEKHLKKNTSTTNSIVLMLGNGNGQEDCFPGAQLHKKWIKDQLTKTTNLYCVHCEEPIAGEDCYLLEIDNESESLKVGYSHIECCRPVDRVLGKLNGPIFDNYSYLKTFDYAFWAKAKGQRLFQQLKNSGNNICTVLWNSDNQSIPTGRFCIKANLEHDEYTYITQRGYVVRDTKSAIETQTKSLNEMLNDFTDANIGFTSKSNTFGPYSSVSTILEVGEEFRKCISFECVRFSSTIRELYDVEGDYYTPLAYLTIEDDISIINDSIFMLTNPLDLKIYLDNWKEKIGYDLGNNYCVVTLKNDDTFDNFMKRATNNSIRIIVDPWFGNEQDLVRGYILKSFHSEIQKIIENSNTL